MTQILRDHLAVAVDAMARVIDKTDPAPIENEADADSAPQERFTA